MGAASIRDELAAADAEGLSAFAWVMPASHSPFRELQLDIFNKFGIVPARTIGADSEEVIRALVLEGKALALVREDEGAAMLDSGLAAECALVGRHSVEVNFVYRKGEDDLPSLAAIIELVRRTWEV